MIKIFFWLCWNPCVDVNSALFSAETDSLSRPCGNSTNNAIKVKGIRVDSAEIMGEKHAHW